MIMGLWNLRIQVMGLWDCVTGLQEYEITGLWDYEIMGIWNYGII